MADFCDVSSWLVLKHESFKGAVTESELDGYKNDTMDNLWFYY